MSVMLRLGVRDKRRLSLWKKLRPVIDAVLPKTLKYNVEIIIWEVK